MWRLTRTLSIVCDIDLVSTTRPMDDTYGDVPGPDARWWTAIDEFALTYNAYDRKGDFDIVSGIDQQVRQA